MDTNYKKCLDAFCSEIGCKATYFPQYRKICIDCMMNNTVPVFLRVYRTSTGNYLGYSHITCGNQDEDPYLNAIKSILGCTLSFPERSKIRRINVPKTLKEFVYLYAV